MSATLKDLYNALKADGRFSEPKDFGTFASKMNERGYSSMVYNTVKNAGADVPDIATFRKNLGVHVWKQGEGKQNVRAKQTKPTSAVGRAVQSVEQERWGNVTQSPSAVAEKNKASVSPTDSMPQGRGPLLPTDDSSKVDKVRYPKLDDNSSALVRSMALSYVADQENKPTSYTKPGALVDMEKRRQKRTGRIFEQTGREYANEERERLDAPAFDAGNEGANEHIVKTQGQLEKEMSDSANLLANDKSVSDYLSNAIFGEFKGAEKRVRQISQGMTGAGTAGSEMGLGIARSLLENQQKDPDKLLKNLQEKTRKSVSTLFSTPEMREQIEDEAKRLGISTDAYVQSALAPKLQQRLAEEFDKAQLGRYLPKGTAEYIATGINDSLIGTLTQILTMNKSQRVYMQRANAMTGEGVNPYMDKPSMWTNAARGAVSFAADAPVFGLLNPVGGKVATKVFGNGVAQTARAANMSWYGRMGYMAGSAALNQGTTGLMYGGLNSAVQNYSTGDDTSLANTMKVALSGAASEGASWATMGAFGGLVGGGLYKAGWNGRGKNLFKNGVAKVGSDVLKIGAEGLGMHLGGNVAKTIRGEDTNWFSMEGVLEDCANVVALKLSHAHKFLGKAAGMGRERGKDGKRESYGDFVARNLANYFYSDAAKGARFKFTDEEKKEFRPYIDTYFADVRSLLRTPKTKVNDADNEKIKTAYDQIMADENITWDAKAKYNALVMGTMPSTRPMMDYWNVATNGDKKVIEERAKDGTLLSRTTYDTTDTKDAIAFRLLQNKEEQRMENANFGLFYEDLDNTAIQEEYMRSLGYDFENPNNPRNKVIEESMAKAREDYENSAEDLEGKNNIYKGYFDFTYEHGTLKKVEESFLEERGMTFSDLYRIGNKFPWERTDEEHQIMLDYRRALEKALFPEDKVHEEQSQLDGKDVAEENNLGGEEPNGDAVKATLAELKQAEDGLQEFMDGNEVFASEYERLKKQGASNAQIYQALINNGMTQEELVPFAKYINANAKVQGMVDGTQKRIAQNVQSRVMEWSYKGELNGEKQSGENVVYVTDSKGRVLVVASGDVSFDAEGKPKEDVGDMLVVYDTATGEVDFVSAKDVTFRNTESAEEFGKRYTQQLQELNSRAYVEAQQEQGGEDKPSEASLSHSAPLTEERGNGAGGEGNQTGTPQDLAAPLVEEGTGAGEDSKTLTFADGTPIPMTTDSKGRQTGDLTKMSAEHGAEYLETTLGGMAGEYVDGKIKAAEDAMKKAEKTKVDMSGDMADVQEAIMKKNEAIAKAKAEHEMYAGIKKAMTEKKVKAAMEAAGGNGMPLGEDGSQTESLAKARAKFEGGQHIVGNKRTRTLADGTKIRGHYELVEAESLTPSHDATDGYKKSEGFPVNENGSTMNDRDYEHDKDAQRVTDMIARKYDGQAVDQVPVVTEDGIVVDGNGRTMAGQKAAKDGTDGAYLEALKENAENYGFTAEQVEGMNHPRLVLVSDEKMPYNTATFAKFNKTVMKSQDNTQQAIANLKKLTSDEISAIVAEVEGAGSLDAFFNNPTAINSLLKRLIDKGVIGQNEVAGLREGEDKLSAQGKDFVRNLLLGSIFSEDTIRMMGNDSVLKNKALNGVRAVIENMKLGEYALGEEIDKAMQLLYEARQAGGGVDALLRTTAMFGENTADRYDPISQAIALALEGKAEDFRELMLAYNRNTAHYADATQMEMFGERPTKEDFVNEFLKFINWKDYETRHSNEEETGDAGGSAGGKQGAQGGGRGKETQQEVEEGVKTLAVEITKRVGEDLVVTNDKEAERVIEENETTIDGSKLRFQIKTPEQRKAAENAYNWAQQHRPSEYATYAVIDMSRPDAIPQYFEMKDLAKHFKKYWSMISNGEYKLVNLDKTFEENVKDFTGDVPDTFNPSGMKFHKESDEEVLERLDKEPKVKVFRAMQVLDGKLYPPMAAAVNGKRVEANELGVWIRSDENPDLAIPDIDPKTGEQKVDPKTGELKWKFKLDKGGKDATGKKATNVNAAYNPYWHTSRSPLNDQFKSAWIRPNIVIVECEVPESELTSGYKAERAKDAVGEVDWKSGSVSGEIYNQTGRARKVILSRWCKPIRVLSDAEFAQRAKEYIGEADVEIPENVVTPKQRVELEKVGVKIGKPEKGVNKSEQIAEALEKGLLVDNSLKKTDDVKRMEFRTKSGEVYGFTDGEKIYLDTKKMKPETPLHEYTHLWGSALRRVNPEEWENVKELLDKVDGLKEEIQKLYPELKDDDLYDEMLAMFSGREGTKKLESVCRKLAAEDGKTVADSVKAQGFIDKVRTALQKFWKATADLLHVHFTTAEEVADKVLADWAKGYDPREKKAEDSTVQTRRDELLKRLNGPDPKTKDAAWSMVVEAKELVDEYFGLPYEDESVRVSKNLTIADIKRIATNELSKIKDEPVEPATEKQMDYLGKLLSEDGWRKAEAALKGVSLNKRQASWLIDRIKSFNADLYYMSRELIEDNEQTIYDTIDLMRKFHGLEAFDWEGKTPSAPLGEEGKGKSNVPNEPSTPPSDPIKGMGIAAEHFKDEQRGRNGQQKEKTSEERAAARLKEQQAHPLTKDEIDTYNTGDSGNDEMAKEYAKDYLDGDRNPMTEIYYNEIYDNVRNRRQDGEGDSSPADTPHMDGGDDAAGESGRDGGTVGRVDGEPGGEIIPEGNASGESRESGTSVPNGEGSNKPVGEKSSTVEGVSTRSRERGGSSKSSGVGVADTKSKPASESNAGTGSDKQSAKAAFEESGKEIKDIFAKLKELREANRKSDQGKLNAYPGLASAVVGELAKKMLPRNKEEFSLYSQLMKACIKHAYNGLRLFGEKAEIWFNGMKESLHDAVKDVYGDVLTDEDVDNFIKSMWNTKYTIDGKRQTIEQWAAEFGHEKLREALRKPLEQKRKEQQEAESVEVKVGDAVNIAETLPFLLPAQQEDVLKAEKQFFNPSHADDAHGNGRGMMFTNGTGTGKTYTGLGIAKRFIKQGKGRVLIVTPSPAKVNDWSNDAKNLGITLTPLKGETGKGATMQKGEGAVVTTFANFRQNRALMEDTFDLVIYDESHKLMENKDATESATTLAHYRMTNKDFTSAMERLQLSHPLWREAEQLEKEKSDLLKGYNDADAASMDPLIPEENVNRAREIEKRLKDVDKEKEKILPELTKKAREAVGKTKVVFLSATPFNMRENIEYAEGYLFKYPTPKRPDNISDEEWAAMKREGKNTFFRQWFPNGERIGQNGKIEPFVSDADKSDAEERNFADHLMELGVMSGRTIDNGYDYSRDFPMVSVTHANTFNTAVRELSQNPQLRAACSMIFDNYNVMSVVYETMKVAATADRIKQHLAMGRKVVIFHRRVNDRMGLARPPFEAVLDRAELAAQGLAKSGGDGKIEAQRIRNEIAKFKEKYKDLLDWEQTLDYRMPREQLASLLGDTHDYTPEEMQARNNAQSQLITPLFNGHSNMNPYEAGREFAKSCFDFEDADIVEQYKPHQVTEEESEVTGERVTSAAQHKKEMAEWRAIAKEVKRGVEDVIRERVESGELKIELGEDGKKKRKVGLFAGADSKSQKIADMDSFNKDDSGMDVIVVQEASGKEGISLHDTTGVHQRVMINLALPQSPIAFIQAEGRIYRIGQMSNAIFEYPLLGIDNEISLFAGRFNTRAATTENLALGNMARGLKNAIMRGVLAKRGKVPLEGQGYGGRDWDMRDDQRATGYDAAVEDWKNEHKDDQTGTIDDIGTPHPLGFKLVDWAQMSDGEKTLEPSAGEGNVSRYFPSGVKSLSVEPDTNKYNTLMLITGGVPYDSAEASGRRTTVANKTFEDLSSRAKYDTIVMNSPNGAEGKKAKEHLELAVAHLNDSGRIVAVLPETESMDKFVKELTDSNPSLHLSGEVKLPMCAYSIGGVSQKAKVVVIDMLKREEVRKKWSDTQTIDLSDARDIEDFFKKLKDVKVPERVLDPAAKDMQYANNVKTVLSKIKAFNDGKTGYKSQTTIEIDDKGIYISPERKFFRMACRRNENYTYINDYGTKVSPNAFESYIKYEDIKKLSPEILTRYVMCSDMAKMSDADVRKNFFNEYSIKRTDEAKMPSYIDAMRQYGESVAKMIRGISGRSDAQLRRAAKGEDIDNPVNVKAGTKMTIDDYKALFEANNEDEEMGALFNRVYDVAKKLGLNIDVFNDENTGTSAYYDNSNSIRINEAHWNTKKIVNSQGKIVTATKGLRAQVLCHELIHSVTSYANYWYDHNPEYLSDNLREAANELNDVYNKIMHDKESYKIPMYARENKNELVAEMANPEVREPLKKIGMWTRLVNAVKKFFMGDEKKVAVEGGFAKEKDFEQSTVYNELSKTLDKFLNNFDKNSYDAFIRMSGTQNESVRNMSFGGDKPNWASLSLSKPLEKEGSKSGGTHYRMELGKTFSDSKENFDGVRDRAVEENGIVMPNLNKESVNVVKVDSKPFGEDVETSLTNAKVWAKENVVTKDGDKLPTMKDGTPYVISKKAINKYLSESATNKSDNLSVHLSVLPKLTDVIHESIEAEIHPDYKKGEDETRSAENGYGDNVLVHRLYGAVELDGKMYRVKTTMQEFRGGEENKPHSYEVTKIELLEGSKTANESDSLPLNSATNSSISVAKLLDGVEKSYDKGKKLLDESKDLTEGEVHFRNGNRNSQPREQSVSEKHISEVVAKTARKTGGKVKQVHNVEEIDNEQVRKDIEDGKEVTGWYDEKTGEVHLYMPNIHDSYTAEKTVWHETVGHKGMRGLLGDKFHKYLRSLWMDMDSPVFEELHEYVKERMAREPLSMYDAIEEFVADMAEKGKGEAGFWNNVRNKVTDVLHELGYRLCPNVKDVKYMLWLAKNVQKHEGDPVWKMRAEAVKWKIDHDRTEYTTADGGEIRSVDGKAHGFESMTKEEWNEATDGEIHYRTSPSAATALDRYHRMLSAHGYMAVEAFADNMAAVDRLMRALDPTIKRIEDVSAAMNPYMLRTVLDGTASDKMQRFEADVMQPLDKYMARLIDAVDGKNDKEKIRNFNLYMIKKHGLERNRVFFVRDAVKNMDEAKRKQTLTDFNTKRKVLGDQLRKGGLMLSQYYTELDEWIRQNVNNDYKAGEHDYSGMHGMYGIDDRKTPYDDIQVQDEVMSAERAMEGMEKGSVEKFWGQVKVATQYSLDEDYKNGFVTKANHESVSDMFDWYVPLRKFDEQTAEDVYGYVTETGNNKTAIGPAIIKAKGRKSLSETNILAQIGAMANFAVARGSQNKLKQAFALFVRNKGGQGLVTETKAWIEQVGVDMNGNPIWKEVCPDIEEGDTADDIARKVEAFEQDMKQKQAQGLAKNLTDRGDIGFKFERKTDKDQHFVDVMIAGKTHRFVINGNPRAAQALNGQLENSAVTDRVRRTIKSVTRFMAQMATSYNPEFVMRNAIRDAGFALQNVTAREGARYGAIWAGYYAKMLPVGVGKLHLGDIQGSVGWGLYAKYRNGTLDTSKEIEKWFKEFMENGGETGFVQIKNLQQWEKQYKRDILRERSLSAKTAKALKDFFVGNVECANEVVENMARFAAYCASRHMKRSVQRCAYDAKQVSMNFNRHGSGDAIGSFETSDMGKAKKMRRAMYGFTAGYLRNYSMFFNAGVQGTQMMFSNIKNAPKATIGTLAVTPFAFGIGMAMLNAWRIGNEDEKKRKGMKDPYAELPEYIRRNNLCIYLGEGKFATIPLAIEHRAFYGLGDIVAGLTTSPRLRNERNIAMDMTGCLSQLFPVVDFVNSAQFDKHPVTETVKGVTPTMLAPFVEWFANSDWKGAPIRRVGDYSENRPSWKNAYSSTPERLIALNKWANAATNDVDPGNPNMKGAEWADALTDPSMLNHIIGTLGGGATTTTMRAMNAAEKRRETEWNELPILRNFGYVPQERTNMARTKARWYNYVEAMNKTLANYNELGNKNVPIDERIANIAARFKFENTDEYRKVDIIKRAQKQLTRLRKLRNRSIEDKTVTDGIDQQMNLVIQDAVSRLEEYDKQKSSN